MSEQKIELMYRQPGLPEHQNITDVLDEIILTIRDMNERLTVLEEWCHDVNQASQLFKDENYGGTD